MISYDEYIEKLKRYKPGIDYDRMYSKIEGTLVRKPVKSGLALAFALAVLLIAFAAYFNLSGLQAGNNQGAMAYVFEEGMVNGNPLMAYIFGD